MKRWMIVLLVLIVVGALAAGWWWARSSPEQATQFLVDGGLQADRAQEFISWLGGRAESGEVEEEVFVASGSIEGETVSVVSEFGGRIVFWGGGCDTQQVLPFGSAEDVRSEVENRLRTYSRVPGFVFSQVHNIQPDVPLENITALFETVRRWNHEQQ